MWHSAVIAYGFVKSKILCINLKFSKVKVYLVVGYDSTEGNGEERERLWNNLDTVVD